MSRLLLIFIMVSLSVAALFAQGSKERGASITPTSSQVKDLSTEPQVSQNRTTKATTTYGNAKVKRPTQERAARPTEAKANRPATYAPPTNASAAKGGNNGSSQKVNPLKAPNLGTVNWMTLEQALEKSKTEKRKIFVDMYTDWCGWCKHMDSTTFVNGTVAKYLNEHYYPVKFNAEQEKDIQFKDKTYRFKKNGSRGYHELAALWLNNRLSFPTVVFLDEDQQLIQPVPGYQDASKMETIINYFGSDSHKKTPWESYEKKFSNQR